MKYPPSLKTIFSLSTLACASAPVGATILAGDLTNYWRLDGDLTDSVGGSNGTYSSGSPTFTAGFDGTPGGAVDFSGVPDYVSTALTVPTGPKSMSLFFSVTSDGTFDAMAGVGAGQRFYVAYRGDVGTGFANAFGNGGAGQTFQPATGYSPTGTNLALNAYHHLVIVDHGDGTATNYYRSPSDPGHLAADFSFSGTAGGAGTFNIGTIDDAASLAMDGLVDDVALFNRALTLAEAESIWNAGSVAAATIPEPSVFALCLLAGLVGLRRQRK